VGLYSNLNCSVVPLVVSFAASWTVIPTVKKLSYDPKKDFVPLGQIWSASQVLVVSSRSNIKTVADLVAYAKANPGKLTFGSAGNGTLTHLAIGLLSRETGINVTHVPYRATGQGLTAVLGGQIDALASGPSALYGQIRAGKLRALGSWGHKRLETLPDVPTFKELGYDAEFYVWSGLFAPAGVPAAVMAALRDSVRSAVQDPDFKTAMSKIETPISYLDGPEFQKYWDSDAKRVAAAVRRIGRIEGKK